MRSGPLSSCSGWPCNSGRASRSASGSGSGNSQAGYLPLADTTAAERLSANRETPVFLAHGQQDGVVPMARGAAARDLLQAQGQPLEWHEYPMEHSVCIEEVHALQRWLLRVLAPG